MKRVFENRVLRHFFNLASLALCLVLAVSGCNSSSTPPSPISVQITPLRGGATFSQSLDFTVNLQNDVTGAGVTWTASAGVLGSLGKTTAKFLAPNVVGNVTITATSVADATKSASATIGVTDLPGVLTWRNDNTRAGANQKEYALTPALVSTATFGKLFSCPVDGAVYAAPLWAANLAIGGGTHNVIFIATVHDTVYAFDADNTACQMYWQKSLLGTNEIFVSWTDVGTDDIKPDIGIVGTPVIDAAKTTLYVVSKSKTNGTTCTPAASCHQRLHAMNLADGSENSMGQWTSRLA